MRSAWDWAWCSESRAGLVVALALLFGAVSPAHAAVFLSQKEALELAFPDADRVEKRNFLLTAEQTEQIEKRAKARVESRIVRVYVGWRGDERVGYAFIDVHLVRTLTQGLLVVLEPGGAVRSLRVLAFHEPTEYLPREGWFGQFKGKTSRSRLRVDRDIHGVVGATLSARAVTRSVRRCLAYHEVLLAPPKAAD